MGSRTYVGIEPDATPALEDEATGAEIAPGVPGLALADGRGLRPHAAWVTGVVVAGDGELRLRVVVRNPFPGHGRALRPRRRRLPRADAAPARALGAAASPKAIAQSPLARVAPGKPNKIAAFRRVFRRTWLARARHGDDRCARWARYRRLPWQLELPCRCRGI